MVVGDITHGSYTLTSAQHPMPLRKQTRQNLWLQPQRRSRTLWRAALPATQREVAQIRWPSFNLALLGL